MLCKYRHEECEDDDEDESENANNSEEDEESVEDLKPMLKNIQEAVEMFDLLLKKCSLRCEECDFEARNQNGLNMHVKAKHTN